MLQHDNGTLARVIGRVSALLAADHFPTGERAALRRMTPGGPLPLVFHRFALQNLPDGWDRSRKSRADWVTIVSGIAIMSPGAHSFDTPLGAALGRHGYSEARLERLLAAEDRTRRTLLLRAARFLAAKSTPCNWADGARLLLTTDPDKKEALHRRIAGDYYRSMTVPSKG